MGLRRLLNRAAKAEPPARLTELAEGEPDTPTPGAGLFAERKRNGGTAPISPASTEKTAREISPGNEKEARHAPEAFAWRSQRSREDRAAWADYIDRPF
jgi:hypothetical protein